jgi:hypothetical protein
MPFESEAQRRYLYAKHPDVAKKYEAETPPGTKLPERVHWIHRKWKRKR